jgi:hypothetical protein
VAEPFWIDDAYDREYAGDGISRYGTYLNINPAWADDYTDSPVELACAAFRVATSPNMAPGYVRTHSRVLAATCAPCWEFEGGAIKADVTLALSRPPEELRDEHGWTGWRWPGAVEPSPVELVPNAAMLPMVRLVFLVPSGLLYAPADAPTRLTVDDAKTSARWLVEALNDKAGPILDRLEDDR